MGTLSTLRTAEPCPAQGHLSVRTRAKVRCAGACTLGLIQLYFTFTPPGLRPAHTDTGHSEYDGLEGSLDPLKLLQGLGSRSLT